MIFNFVNPYLVLHQHSRRKGRKGRSRSWLTCRRSSSCRCRCNRSASRFQAENRACPTARCTRSRSPSRTSSRRQECGCRRLMKLFSHCRLYLKLFTTCDSTAVEKASLWLFFFDGARRPDFRWWRPPQRWRCQVLWLPSNEMALLIYAQHSSRAIETCLCDGSIRRSPPESAITFECFSCVTFATFRKDPARQWNSAGIELKLLQNCGKSFFVFI